MSAPDLSEFLTLSNCHPTQCVVARSRAQLKGNDRINFDEALTRKDDRGEYVIPNNAVSKWLKSRGLPGRDDAVKKHRAGGCVCPPLT